MALSRHNTNIINWGIDTKDYPYVKLSELEEGKSYPLLGCYITADNGYGEGAVFITDGRLINVPQRYTDLVKEIRASEEDVQQIKDGKAAFKYSTFQPKNHKNKGYSITLEDLS